MITFIDDHRNMHGAARSDQADLSGSLDCSIQLSRPQGAAAQSRPAL